MAIPRIPINQQDAFPILTVEQTASPGDIQLVGNTLTRYFSPAIMNINNIVMTAGAGGEDGGALGFMRSNALDLRGCRAFAMVLTRILAANQADPGEQVKVYAEVVNYQSTFQPGSFPSLLNTIKVGAITLGTQGNTAGTQIVAFAWVNGSLTSGVGGGANTPQMCTIGLLCRFYFWSNINPATWPTVAPTYSAELWASQI